MVSNTHYDPWSGWVGNVYKVGIVWFCATELEAAEEAKIGHYDVALLDITAFIVSMSSVSAVPLLYPSNLIIFFFIYDLFPENCNFN